MKTFQDFLNESTQKHNIGDVAIYDKKTKEILYIIYHRDIYYKNPSDMINSYKKDGVTADAAKWNSVFRDNGKRMGPTLGWYDYNDKPVKLKNKNKMTSQRTYMRLLGFKMKTFEEFLNEAIKNYKEKTIALYDKDTMEIIDVITTNQLKVIRPEQAVANFKNSTKKNIGSAIMLYPTKGMNKEYITTKGWYTFTNWNDMGKHQKFLKLKDRN